MGKKHDRIAKRAAAKVAERHKEAPAAEASMPRAVTTPPAPRKSKEAKPGALPALPKLPSASRSRKPRPTQPCACGCETPTTGMWAPGHDARAKGWAIRIERGICKMSDVPANEQAGAKLVLKSRKETGEQPVKGKGIKLAKSDKGKVVAAEVEPAAAVEGAAVEGAAEVVNE